MRDRRSKTGVAWLSGTSVLGAALGASAPAAAFTAPPATTPALVAAAHGRLALLSPSTGIRVVLPQGVAQPAWSPGGRRIAFARGGDIYVLTLPNGLRRLTATPGVHDSGPAWSPDGTAIAWASGAGSELDIRLMDADGDSKRLLAGGAGGDVEPAWDPDGSRVFFATDRGGDFDLWAVDVSSGTQSPVVQRAGDQREPAVSPDGGTLAFSSREGGNTDVWTASTSGASPVRLTSAPAADAQPAWSPGGARLAFTSRRGGSARIWKMRADGSRRARVASSRAGDFHPSWATSAAAVRVLPLPTERLPDLDQRPPAGLVVIRRYGRFLLGFASAVDNVGTGPLWIRGTRPNRRVRTMRADQLVERGTGRVRRYASVGRLRFESHPPHHHWHFQPFERYELRRASDFSLIVSDRKTGFCLADHYGHAARRVAGFGPPRFLGRCGLNDRGRLRVQQGSSIGYTDRYPALFHGQDVDLTGVPAGLYVLVHRANPERAFKELRYDNNAASLLVRVSWPRGRSRAPRVRVLERCPASELCG